MTCDTCEVSNFEVTLAEVSNFVPYSWCHDNSYFEGYHVTHYFRHLDDDSIGMCLGSQKDLLHEKNN
jgi:hypothetical protein